MKVLILACMMVVAAATPFLEEHAAKFQAFKVKHGKIYKNRAEEIERFNIFRKNLRLFEEHNALYEQGLVTYKKGINQFTDRTEDELNALLNHKYRNSTYFNAVKHVKSGLVIPDSVDWRTDGQVAEVKNQGECGSCWAFSSTGSLEAAYKRKTGNLVSFSEQQLVDCARVGGCRGVSDLKDPTSYIVKYGLESEDSYPYSGGDDICSYDASRVVANVSSYHVIDYKDEAALLDAVANVGPVSVAMDATGLSNYESGIYQDKDCSDTLTHAVLIVGYGSDNGLDFWIVKNSYGTEFGENGYFRILRGVNECGISDDALYPILK